MRTEQLSNPRTTTIARSRWVEVGVCGVFLLAGGLISVALGKNMNWDLLNYHFYNGWALLNRPWGVDLFPAQLQTFFNPVLDSVFYIAQKSFPDGITVFLMGLPIGACAYLVWRILPLLANYKTNRLLVITIRVAAVSLALTGAAALSQAGTTTNEWGVLVFVLGGFWALLSAFRSERAVPQLFLVAGLLLGTAAGLKLTASTQIIAVTLAIPWILRHKSSATRSLVYYVAGGSLRSRYSTASGCFGRDMSYSHHSRSKR